MHPVTRGRNVASEHVLPTGPRDEAKATHLAGLRRFRRLRVRQPPIGCEVYLGECVTGASTSRRPRSWLQRNDNRLVAGGPVIQPPGTGGRPASVSSSGLFKLLFMDPKSPAQCVTKELSAPRAPPNPLLVRRASSIRRGSTATEQGIPRLLRMHSGQHHVGQRLFERAIVSGAAR